MAISMRPVVWAGTLLALSATGVPAHAAKAEPPVPYKCQQEAKRGDAAFAFSPRAVTLASLNVRAKTPEYSFIQGQWVLGPIVEVLERDTCLEIIDKELVGVVQIWYLVRYRKDPKNPPASGWVWGGTVGVDDTRYIGGDTTPRPLPKSSSLGRGTAAPWAIFATPLYAQADSPADQTPLSQHAPALAGAGPPSEAREGTARENFVAELPVLRWRVNVGIASAVMLFLAMVGGMAAKAIWDQTEKKMTRIAINKVLRPLLISPIAFSAFWGPFYLQKGSAGLSLTAVLYAFQIGFMWQHVLEKRLSAGEEGGGRGSGVRPSRSQT